jgi:phosphohistidine phosphatase SixA
MRPAAGSASARPANARQYQESDDGHQSDGHHYPDDDQNPPEVAGVVPARPRALRRKETEFVQLCPHAPLLPELRPGEHDDRKSPRTLRRVSRRLLIVVVLAALAATAGCGTDGDDAAGERQSEAATERASGPPVERLRRGGYVVALRHAATDPTATDMTGDLSDCSRQRNLNAAGRRQARAIGRAFRELGIPVGRVLASPFCRTRDTARLAFGRVRPSRALLSADFFASDATARQRAGLRRLLATPPGEGTNTVLVSHEAAIDAAAGVTVAEGESVIVAPRRGGRPFRVVSTVEAAAWERVARAER